MIDFGETDWIPTRICGKVFFELNPKIPSKSLSEAILSSCRPRVIGDRFWENRLDSNQNLWGKVFFELNPKIPSKFLRKAALSGCRLIIVLDDFAKTFWIPSKIGHVQHFFEMNSSSNLKMISEKIPWSFGSEYSGWLSSYFVVDEQSA